MTTSGWHARDAAADAGGWLTGHEHPNVQHARAVLDAGLKLVALALPRDAAVGGLTHARPLARGGEVEARAWPMQLASLLVVRARSLLLCVVVADVDGDALQSSDGKTRVIPRALLAVWSTAAACPALWVSHAAAPGG